jgi:hypothetical protein
MPDQQPISSSPDSRDTTLLSRLIHTVQKTLGSLLEDPKNSETPIEQPLNTDTEQPPNADTQVIQQIKQLHAFSHQTFDGMSRLLQFEGEGRYRQEELTAATTQALHEITTLAELADKAIKIMLPTTDPDIYTQRVATQALLDWGYQLQKQVQSHGIFSPFLAQVYGTSGIPVDAPNLLHYLGFQSDKPLENTQDVADYLNSQGVDSSKPEAIREYLLRTGVKHDPIIQNWLKKLVQKTSPSRHNAALTQEVRAMIANEEPKASLNSSHAKQKNGKIVVQSKETVS